VWGATNGAEPPPVVPPDFPVDACSVRSFVLKCMEAAFVIAEEVSVYDGVRLEPPPSVV